MRKKNFMVSIAFSRFPKPPISRSSKSKDPKCVFWMMNYIIEITCALTPRKLVGPRWIRSATWCPAVYCLLRFFFVNTSAEENKGQQILSEALKLLKGGLNELETTWVWAREWRNEPTTTPADKPPVLLLHAWDLYPLMQWTLDLSPAIFYSLRHLCIHGLRVCSPSWGTLTFTTGY